MDIDAPPAYTAHEAKYVTFAEVATRIAGYTGNLDDMKDALEAFRAFLASQENVTLSKNQLQVLKGQGVLVLEEAANRLQSGGNASEILPKVASIFLSVSGELESKTNWEVVLQERDGPKQLETVINEAFNGLEELRELLKGTDSKSTMNRDELLNARQEDQKELEELQAVIEETQPAENLATRALESMNRNLKIIGDPTVAQPHQDAKRALSVIAQLTGQSLPPYTVLGKEFVTIGQQAVHQGSSYDIFLGEYFTGEKIAIKVLRHRVDEDTANKMHERFVRQAFNWSSLRHDAVLPFYGVGVVPSSVAQGEFQLYLVSPYLQNRDAKHYLTKYNSTPPKSRLQMSLDIARGLRHMHEAVDLPGHGIVHSALNISNVLIKDSERAAISGFGHTKILQTFRESFTGDNQDYRYMAPELMQDEPRITHGTDIYAWAMTTLEILTDVPPFGAKTNGPRIIQRIATGQKPNRADHPAIEQYACKDELWTLLEDCWNNAPDARPSANVVVQRLMPLLPSQVRSYQVNSHMSVAEILDRLARHNCPNMTGELDIPRSSQQAISGGGYGDIYGGYLKSGLRVAIKCPRIYSGGDLADDDNRRYDIMKRTAHEMYAASKLIRHRNILEVIGVADFRDSVAIISPWMEHGAVTEYLKRKPDSDRRGLCAQVASGLSHMHQKGIVHGDLKGLNVLVSSDGVAQIADFGNTILDKYTLHFTGTRATPIEMLQGITGVSQPADVYALGMTILEIITGKLPFHGTPELMVWGAILRQELPPRPQASILLKSPAGDKLWELITMCWARKPNERPSAAQVETILSGASTTTGKTPLLQQQYLPRERIQDDVREESKPAAPSASHAALAKLDDLQASLSQLDSSNFQAEQSVLENLRRKLSGLNIS